MGLVMRGGRASTIAAGVYFVCLVFVCSFILFEVLDVDGSDFPAPPQALRPLSTAEATHDIKRLALPSVLYAVGTYGVARDGNEPPQEQLVAPGRRPTLSASMWRSVMTLARAALPDRLLVV